MLTRSTVVYSELLSQRGSAQITLDRQLHFRSSQQRLCSSNVPSIPLFYRWKPSLLTQNTNSINKHFTRTVRGKSSGGGEDDGTKHSPLTNELVGK